MAVVILRFCFTQPNWIYSTVTIYLNIILKYTSFTDRSYSQNRVLDNCNKQPPSYKPHETVPSNFTYITPCSYKQPLVVSIFVQFNTRHCLHSAMQKRNGKSLKMEWMDIHQFGIPCNWPKCALIHCAIYLLLVTAL